VRKLIRDEILYFDDSVSTHYRATTIYVSRFVIMETTKLNVFKHYSNKIKIIYLIGKWLVANHRFTDNNKDSQISGDTKTQKKWNDT